MKNLYFKTENLDQRAVNFGLKSKILMENAAASMAKQVRKRIKKGSKILGVSGGGNNGADVIATLRILQGDYDCELYLTGQKLKFLALTQLQIAKNFGVKIVDNIGEKDTHKCVIEGIFGSGINRDLDENMENLVERLNQKKAYKIACDIPMGINPQGQIHSLCFKADLTLCMGGLKMGLYSDKAKDFCGNIKRAKLGLSDTKFQFQPDGYLLEKSDLKLPFRHEQNTNKGDFGHAFFVCGKLHGAAVLSAMAAQNIGAGLVSLITKNTIKADASLMQSKKITEKMLAGAVGMGLSENDIKKLDFDLLKSKKLVLDAGLCYEEKTLAILDENKVITPHPKEFVSLLKFAKIADISVSELQDNRFAYAKTFTKIFKCVLVLKGANTIIAKAGRVFVCDKGTNVLAKGGSGDVLAGIIAGLMAQGYTPLKAAVCGVLAHAFSAKKFKKNNYSLNPKDIIKGLKCLKK
ncbi:MAG: NAD(P)H-hydrate dehydratase [Campylobacter sp.]|nr:NAD(P)H-hydrate dehydratase [Campylobacter sp.]